MPAALPVAVSALAMVVAFSLLGGPATQASGALPLGWSQGPSLPPSDTGSWGTAAVYFPPLDQVVLFGGSPKIDGETWSNQTWIYAGGAWRLGPSAPAGLTPRGSVAMAYDPDIGKIVLFGGAGSEWPMPADTWLYDGSSWSPGPSTPPAMSARTGASMAYDAALHKVVLFGGSGIVGLNDTWLFDGSSWSPGPAAPAGMGPRAFFGMTYDPVLQTVLVAGGNGGTDAWYFDGSSWSPAPSIAVVGPKERFTMAYDPQLGGPVLFGGLGVGASTQAFWYLRGGTWTQVSGWTLNAGWPDARVDAMLVFHPTQDALMLVGGIDDALGGNFAYTDSWFFREAPPQVSSVTVTPASANQAQKLTMTLGSTTGGYGNLAYSYAWFVNGIQVPGVTGKTLQPGPYHHGDQVVAKAMATDAVGNTVGWTASAPDIIVDRPPSLKSAAVTPGSPYVTNTLSATATTVKDLDGDAVTLHYKWKVAGTWLPGNDAPTLAPANFAFGQSVLVQITPTDSVGVSGTSQTSPAVVPQWNVQANSSPPPGGLVGIKGGGYWASEKIDIRFDSPTASNLTVLTASSTGGLLFTNVTMPSPASGGTHMLYGVGESSHIAGLGPVTIVPGGSLSTKAVAAGDVTVFSGAGYVPGDTVSVSFPGGTPVQASADATGSVSVAVTSPPEPQPGGMVSGVSGSGTATTAYTVNTVLSAPLTSEPQQIVPISIAGYGPSEQVAISFDAGPTTLTVTTDANGSATPNLTLDATFGGHNINATGVSSGVTATVHISLPTFVQLAPASGASGATIEVMSGPGWAPNEVVQILWNGTVMQQVTADSNGAIDTNFVTPTHKAGTVTLAVHGTLIGLTASTVYTILG
jgi:hypothetical protein